MTRSPSLDNHPAENKTEDKSDILERIGSSLDEWRARIDELVLQLDLANLDLRDEVRKSLDVTQNIYLAAHSKLSDARRDASSSAISLQQSLEKFLRDLALTFEETSAVVKRARQS